jgi:putative ABC transport system ATP-binding protein
MDPRFLSFVWRYSKRDQLIILALTVATFPLVYVSLEIPKIIINEAIGGTDFPKEFLGLELAQIPYLLALCFAFLFLVVAINGIKWLMNVRIGITGERMLRRMRFMLFERVMLFPMQRFRSTKPGEVIQSLLGEIEPLGGFIGEVVSTPAFQGGLLVVYMTFIFVQDWLLGLAAISLYPLQAYLIPKLQARVVRLNRERAGNTRKLADTIGETIHVIPEVHTNATARWHMAQVAARLYENTVIRIDIFKRKFTIKIINNFINQLTPFFFYSVGGYLVITGRLDLGSLVAVLAAYKDVAAPWKEVLNYVQRWSDFNSRYTFVVESYSGEDVLAPTRLYSSPEASGALSGALVFDEVEGGPGTGGLTIPRLEVPAGRMMAVTGGDGGGREALLKLAAGLQPPAAGHVTFGAKALIDCPMPQVGATVGYVGAEPGLVARSMRQNLLYGLLRGNPDLADQLAGQGDATLADMLREARLTGNTTAWPDGDWIDYAAAGVSGPAELDARLLHLVEVVGLSGELYSGALETRLSRADADAWTGPILKARNHLRMAGADLSDLVEDWRPDALNTNGRLLGNVLYALPVDPPATVAGLAEDRRIIDVLDRSGGTGELIAIGWDIAREFADLVDAVEGDSTVLDSFQGYGRASIRAARDLVAAAPGKAPGELTDEQRKLLLTLAFAFVPTRDRLDVLDADRIARLLACRQKARALLQGREDFVGFDEDRFSPARRVADNILHGQRRYDRRSQWKRLEEMMERAIEAAGLRDDLIRLGLGAEPGSGGGLSTASRRRVALVRGLIKRPRLLVLDGVAGTDTAADATLRLGLRAELPAATILYAALEEGAVRGADMVARIAENGLVRVEEVARRPDAAESSESAASDERTRRSAP